MKSKIADAFKKFLSSLENKDECINSDISKQIYFDMFRIRLALWTYKENIDRGKDFTLAEIFQDIIAHYLRIKLPQKYKVILEKKEKKSMPDILIKKKKKNWAIIEIKTTIGWNRKLVKEDKYKGEKKKLVKKFKINGKRIFYIFESYSNMEKPQQKRFEDQSDQINKVIFPLFKYDPAPYYIIGNKDLVKFIFSEEEKKKLLKEIAKKENKRIRKLTNVRILKVRDLNYIKRKYTNNLISNKLYKESVNKNVKFSDVIKRITNK